MKSLFARRTFASDCIAILAERANFGAATICGFGKASCLVTTQELHLGNYRMAHNNIFLAEHLTLTTKACVSPKIGGTFFTVISLDACWTGFTSVLHFHILRFTNSFCMYTWSLVYYLDFNVFRNHYGYY